MNGRPWFAHYDKGVPYHIDYPAIPLFGLLEEAASKYPDQPCTIFNGAVITFRKMNQITDQLAAGIAALGVKKGDRVGIDMVNSPQFVIAFFAILKAGGVAVAINPLYSPREIIHQVNDAGIEFIFVMSKFYNEVKKAQPSTKVKKVVVTNIKDYLPPVLALLFTLAREKKEGFRVDLAEGDMWFKDLLKQHKPEERPMLDIGPDDVAIFQYSGGTTGISKGAVALHRNLVANALQCRSWFTQVIDGKEAVLMAIPLFHVFGMVAGMLFGIRAGASLIMIPDARNTKDILSSIQRYKASIFPGVPTMYNAINNNPEVIEGKFNLSSIKGCISGSAPLMRDTKEKFEALTGGKLVEGYGLSEAPTATHCNPLFGEIRSGSIGLPMPDVDSQIISLEDGVTPLKPGEEGELCIKGPQIMKGYHNMPTETANTLRDGWLYTGDIAKMDEDGYFYIVDRKKELIKPGGYQVWPREVEEVISSYPKVLEVGVAGVMDAYRGETVKAWVVLKPGETATEEEIRDYCKKNMAHFKVPTQVEFRKELPKTMVGKVLRRELVREHMEKLQAKK
jgi:long-chain acyl-CoA synthetase